MSYFKHRDVSEGIPQNPLCLFRQVGHDRKCNICHTAIFSICRKRVFIHKYWGLWRQVCKIWMDLFLVFSTFLRTELSYFGIVILYMAARLFVCCWETDLHGSAFQVSFLFTLEWENMIVFHSWQGSQPCCQPMAHGFPDPPTNVMSNEHLYMWLTREM